MPADVLQLLREHDSLLALRRPWERDWQAIADTMLPMHNDIVTRRTAGETRTDDLFDSTAMIDLDLLSSHINGAITNFSMQWFALRMRFLRGVHEAEAWLDDVARLQLEAMTDDDSPVPPAVHEFYLQYAGQGTGCLFTDERPIDEVPRPGFRGILARSMPVGTYAIAQNSAGKVDTVHRCLEMSPHQAMQQFGLDALAMPMQELLRDPLRSTSWYTPVPFVHAVYPVRGAPGPFAYQSVYIDRNAKHLVSESGYRQFPYQVARWAKINSGNPWGYGRGHLALPDALTLNQIDQDALRMLAIQVQPPVWLIGAGQETVGRVSLMPGAMNPIASGGDVRWDPPRVQFDIQNFSVAERRQRIDRIFYVDQLSFLPDPREQQKMTAFEVAQRQAMMQRLMGPAFMRLLSEFLNPFLDTVFSLLLHAGELPEPPDAVIEAALANQGRIDIEYEGPLARAQRDTEVQAIDEALELGVRLATEMQDKLVLQNIDVDQAFVRRLEVRGFPKSLIRDRAFMREVRQRADQEAEQMAQTQQAQAQAQVARDAAPVVRELREVAGV